MKKFLKGVLVIGVLALVGKAVYDYIQDKKMEEDEAFGSKEDLDEADFEEV
jgi:hypothetical protein